MIIYHKFPPGTLLLEEQNSVLTRCMFINRVPGDNYQELPLNNVLSDAISQLTAYFEGHLRVFDLPLVPASTTFQNRVRKALEQVPYGHTVSYGQLAASAGTPFAVRAVGRTLGANPFHIIVPCHRVLRASGALGGFAAGPEIKKFLLDFERHHDST